MSFKSPDEGRKPRLVSYTKQSALPKFLDEQPNQSNSPVLDNLIASPGVSSADGKKVLSPRGTPSALRRNLFSGLRASHDKETPDKKEELRIESSLLSASLVELAERSRSPIPALLNECLTWIRYSGAIDSKNVFRGGGNMDKVKELVSAFENNTFKSMERLQVEEADVCLLLRLFFKQISDPVFTFEYFHEWIRISLIKGDQSEDIQQLLAKLPNVHQEVLNYVMAFLRELSVHNTRNDLSLQAISYWFGPLLVRPKLESEETPYHHKQAVRLIQDMLEDYPNIFLSDSETQSEAQSTTPRSKVIRQPSRPPPPIPVGVEPAKPPKVSIDEFSHLAKLASDLDVGGQGNPSNSMIQQEEDSEEDLPESSSDDGEVVPRVPIQGRATIRMKTNVKEPQIISSLVFSNTKDSQSSPTAAPTADMSLSDIDSVVLRDHINELREMPLTPKSERGGEEEAAEDTEKERLEKLAQIRQMLVSDPRFRSQVKVPSAKYEPAVGLGSGKPHRKKSRRKKRHGGGKDGSRLDTSITSHQDTPTKEEGTPAAPTTKKRRPKICGKCKEVVRGMKVNALGKAWHPACFLCSSCGKQLADFFECKGLPYCSDHIGEAEEKAWGLVDKQGQALCGKCKQVVDKGTIVSALGKKWHSSCFVCTKCGCSLETYFGAGGMPYCEAHVTEATLTTVEPDTQAPPPAIKAPKDSGGSHSKSGGSNNNNNLTVDSAQGSKIRKKKKKSHRSKRALSNPPPKLDADGGCPECGKNLAQVPAASCAACKVKKCLGCGSNYRAPNRPEAEYVCKKCLPDFMERHEKEALLAAVNPPPAPVNKQPHAVVASGGGTAPMTVATGATAAAAGATVTSGVSDSPRTVRWPRKQDPVQYFDKSKRRVVKRYAVLSDQRLCLYKDESTAKKAKDPLEILDLTLLKKVCKLGVHLDKPFCLAFTIDYETVVIWVDQLEYSNWADAMCDSNHDVVIGSSLD